MSWFMLEDDTDWGGGLQRPDPRFPVGAEVVIKETASGPTSVGPYELAVANEVGTVTRTGHHRILVRMVRRAKPVSIYFPSHLLERYEAAA